MNKSTALIIGGSSGLGLELAHLLSATHRVLVTGRRNPKQKNLQFIPLELDSVDLTENLDWSHENLTNIDLLVYAAGFFQEGKIDNLSDVDIEKMGQVGLLAPAFIIQRIIKNQGSLPGFIAITSTSQWTPRLLEPMYTAVKAALAMLANSLSLDERVGKVLVAGPAGMATRFWENSPRDLSKMLDPKWVAEQILQLYEGNFKYRFARIMRDTARVE